MKPVILLVEDSPLDSRSVRQSFQSAGLEDGLVVVRSAQSAIDYLSGKGRFSDRQTYPEPSVVIVSLQLADCEGFECLRWLQQSTDPEKMLRIGLVQRQSLKQVVRAYELGAHTFLVKPIAQDDLRNLIKSFPRYWDVTH